MRLQLIYITYRPIFQREELLARYATEEVVRHRQRERKYPLHARR